MKKKQIAKKLVASALSMLIVLGSIPSNSMILAADDEDVTPKIPKTMYATKDELTCSWGTPNVPEAISNGKDITAGSDASNQKIKFGSDPDDGALTWWIAGRYNSQGLIKTPEGTGDITTADYTNSNEAMLYAVGVVGEERRFNASGDFREADETADENSFKREDTSAGHWGMSDIRAYLNRGLGQAGDESSKTGLKDTTNISTRSNFEEDYLTQSESNLVNLTTIKTAKLMNGEADATQYETVDRFFLPSGGDDIDMLSFEEDVRYHEVKATLDSLKKENNYLIPGDYWSSVISGSDALLRPHKCHDSSIRGKVVFRSTNTATVVIGTSTSSYHFAPAFKLNIENVSFACAAKAETPAQGASQFSQITDDAMTLRFKSDDFNSTYVIENTAEDNSLTSINYINAPDNSRIVIIASDGTDTFEQSLDVNGSGTINVNKEGLEESKTYTYKAWIEKTVDGITYAKTATEYKEQNLVNAGTNVNIIGLLTEGSKIKVEDPSEDDYNMLVSDLDDAKEVIAAYDISVENGLYKEGTQLELMFNVDEKYNGKVITVKHKLSSGDIETLTAAANDACVKITVSELSPFVLAADMLDEDDKLTEDINIEDEYEDDTEQYNNYQYLEAYSTGDSANYIIFYLSFLIMISSIAAIVLCKKIYAK